MPRRAVHAFVAPPRSTTAPSKNRDGYPSWERPLKEQYIQTLVSNTFDNTFYADEKQMISEAIAVHDAMLKESPDFAAKALVYAREKGYMRTQPIYGLARLFAVAPGLATTVFDRVIRTPNDLADFTSIVKTLRKGEGGRAIKRAAGKWLLNKLDEYRVVKYGADKSEGAYSLRDMVQVYHPDAKGVRLPLIDYVMGGVERVVKGRENDVIDLPMIRNLEALKRATDDTVKASLIRDRKSVV